MKEKRIIYLIMGICSILILLIGITTAWFEWRSEIDTNVTFNVEGLNITYEGEPTVIKGNLYPTMYMNNTDNIIHNFSLVTTSNIEIHSKISLEIITLPTELNHESFRWNLYKDSTQIASGNFLNASVGTDLLLTPYETITTTKSNYTLYIWIDGENYDNPLTMGGQTFEFKLKLEASQQDYATAEECFVFDESTGTITDYLCYSGNSNGLPTITDVVIPSSINGVSVKAIGSTTLASSVSYLNEEKIIASPLVNNLNKKPEVKIIAEQLEDSSFTYKNITSVVIPDSVIIIGDDAFRYNKLTSVVILDSVTTIGNGAFARNNLTSVVIPDSVTSIGNYAFAYNNLSSAYIGANSNLTETTGIGQDAFASINSNLTIYNNSGKKFKWYYVTQGRNNSTEDAYNFITGTVPSYTSGSTTYNEVTITTGGNP